MRDVLLILVGVNLWGCAPQVHLESYSSQVESGLVDTLVGNWRVEGIFQSDCPNEWKRAMPMGQTRWSSQGGQLVIEPVTGASESVVLWPVDEDRLFNTATLTVLDCGVSETISLELDHVDQYWASGVYEATLFHDGSEQCHDLADQADVPDRCTTQVVWQARRL